MRLLLLAVLLAAAAPARAQMPTTTDYGVPKVDLSATKTNANPLKVVGTVTVVNASTPTVSISTPLPVVQVGAWTVTAGTGAWSTSGSSGTAFQGGAWGVSVLNFPALQAISFSSGTAATPLYVQTNSTFPISADSLPLPAGAATSSLQTTGNGTLTSILAALASVPVTGSLTDAQLRASPVPVSGSFSATGSTVVATGPNSAPLALDATVGGLFKAGEGVVVSTGQITAYQGGVWTIAVTPPASQYVTFSSGSLSNPFYVQSVSTLPVSVAALPAITGTVAVSNFPAVQAVSQDGAPWAFVNFPGQALAVVSTGTVTVAGTVTANIGTTGGLALDASVTGLQVGQASSTSGQKGELTQGAATTSAPIYADGTTNPFSLDASGNLRVFDSVLNNLKGLQGLTTIGKNGVMVLGAVTTNTPSLINATLGNLSLKTNGALRTDSSASTQTVAQSGIWGVVLSSGDFSNPFYFLSTGTVISTGSITAFQGGTWNIGSITTLPALVTGSANIGTINGSTVAVVGLGGAAIPVSIASLPSAAVTNAGVFAVQFTSGSFSNPFYTLSTNTALGAGTAEIGNVKNSGTFAVQAAATLAAETTKVIGTINVAAAQTIAVTNAGTFAVQATLPASGSTWTVVGVAGAPIVVRELPGQALAVISTAPITLAAGSASIGTLGANSGVDIGDVTLTAGAALVGKVGIDQTTPGTTNRVDATIAAGQTIGLAAGSASIGTIIIGGGSADMGTVHLSTAGVLASTSGVIGSASLGSIAGKTEIHKVFTKNTAAAGKSVIGTYTVTAGKTLYVTNMSLTARLTTLSATAANLGNAEIATPSGTTVSSMTFVNPTTSQPLIWTREFSEPWAVTSATVFMSSASASSASGIDWIWNFDGYEK